MSEGLKDALTVISAVVKQGNKKRIEGNLFKALSHFESALDLLEELPGSYQSTNDWIASYHFVRGCKADVVEQLSKYQNLS